MPLYRVSIAVNLCNFCPTKACESFESVNKAMSNKIYRSNNIIDDYKSNETKRFESPHDLMDDTSSIVFTIKH